MNSHNCMYVIAQLFMVLLVFYVCIYPLFLCMFSDPDVPPVIIAVFHFVMFLSCLLLCLAQVSASSISLVCLTKVLPPFALASSSCPPTFESLTQTSLRQGPWFPKSFLFLSLRPFATLALRSTSLVRTLSSSPIRYRTFCPSLSSSG